MNVRKLILVFILSGSLSFLFGQSNEDCLDCHDDPTLTKSLNDSTEASLFIDEEAFTNSIHGDLDCYECHADLENFEDEHEEDLQKVNCAECHDDAQADYNLSAHSLDFENSGAITATCTDCHDTHNILSADDTVSYSYKLNIEKMCAGCHSKPEVLAYLNIRGEGPAGLYHDSVHDKKLHEEPDGNAPTCINCHGSHKIMLRLDPECLTSEINLPGTCGACHEEIYTEYTESIHWKSKQRGHNESPGCNDCHGEHNIISPKNKNAITNRFNLSSQICQNCHASKVMMERFGLDPNRMESYLRSYHGLSVLRSSPDAATCTNCHEVHAIKSSLNPASSVHKNNLKQTCGACHKNISDAFVAIEMHPLNQESRNPLAFFVKNFYILLLFTVIGLMVVHNLIILAHYVREKQRHKNKTETYQRFNSWEVYQHVLMVFSFTTLTVTGFALKFPGAAWVQLLGSLGLNEVARSTIHRGAAVVMVIISIIQAGYFIFTQKGRNDFKALIPTFKDISHLLQTMRYYLGLSKSYPKFGRYTYAEKAEYLALIWGVVVMGASGVILWFPEFFLQFLPTWIFETSEVIHYYEAWLATLAIIVWHWFFVLFHPESYPMEVTWIDGKTTLDELKKHHPLEYEKYILNKKISEKTTGDLGEKL